MKAAFIGTKMECTYQTHENLTKGLKTNPNKNFVKKYKRKSNETCMMIFYDNEASPICERCLEFCKSVGQLLIEKEK